MNEETLERLMIDRSLGATSPDVDALLDECLANHPREAERAREYGDLAQRVRTVLSGEPTGRLPAFPRDRLLSEKCSQARWKSAQRVTALAASFLLGIGVAGLGVGVWRPEAAPRPAMLELAEHPDARPSQGDGSGFWSVPRRREPPARGASARGRLIWTTPLSKPFLGGST
jgi:hypothetical protein